MIDLYALAPEFPGTTAAEPFRARPYDRIAALEHSFAEDIADKRFIPYIQLHEFEACLFADPAQLQEFFDCSPSSLRQLARIAESTPPELIDDGQHTAPSKRIIGEIPEYEGAKSTAGPLIAEAIGISRIREQCPHFNAWLSRLEGLAEQADIGSCP
ncbi:MAG: DUF4276 family protein [Bacteroidota bacterium]